MGIEKVHNWRISCDKEGCRNRFLMFASVEQEAMEGFKEKNWTIEMVTSGPSAYSTTVTLCKEHSDIKQGAQRLS
jgi:hypothetical protein